MKQRYEITLKVELTAEREELFTAVDGAKAAIHTSLDGHGVRYSDIRTVNIKGFDIPTVAVIKRTTAFEQGEECPHLIDKSYKCSSQPGKLIPSYEGEAAIIYGGRVWRLKGHTAKSHRHDGWIEGSCPELDIKDLKLKET